MERAMIEFKRILCPVDFSDCSTRALAHAVALARWYEAQLTVLHVVPTFSPMQVQAELGVPVQMVNPMTREEVVERMRQLLERAGVSPEADLVAVAGDASTTIVSQALAAGANLIVIGTHGRRGVRRLLLGSVAETVLHEAPCPVLTVSPHSEVVTPEIVTFKRILCPIDFSPSSLHALGFAADLARQAGGLVTLLHVVEWLPEDEPRASVDFNIPDFRKHMAADAQQRLRALVAEESRTWCEIDDLIAAGRAHREILRVSDERSADLIVMGSQGRGGMGLALFGSTTQQVVRRAACPVLTVRAPEPA
jgi:nucleotide-binding universal stress UspA family protein